jgi:hypothetical protein
MLERLHPGSMCKSPNTSQMMFNKLINDQLNEQMHKKLWYSSVSFMRVEIVSCSSFPCHGNWGNYLHPVISQLDIANRTWLAQYDNSLTSYFHQ